MSRNTVIVLLVLCVGVAALIVLSKKRPESGSTQVAQNTEAPSSPPSANTSGAQAGTPPQGAETAAPTTTGAQPVTLPPGGVGRTTTAMPGTRANPNSQPVGPGGVTAPPINRALTNDLPEVKPLPVLEKDYASATNRDARLDIMMDIAETPGAEAVRALTRLFEIETDGDLKVDLLDSLLGIDGFKEEKLIMLTMGARQGLPQEVRQSAIDGLIDLDDSRVIPVLNGLLNDSDPEIREGAQDALEMLQSAQAQPTIKLIK